MAPNSFYRVHIISPARNDETLHCYLLSFFCNFLGSGGQLPPKYTVHTMIGVGGERSPSHGLRIWGARGGERLRFLSSVCECVSLSGPPKRKKAEFPEIPLILRKLRKFAFWAEFRENSDISLNLSKITFLRFGASKWSKNDKDYVCFEPRAPKSAESRKFRKSSGI